MSFNSGESLFKEYLEKEAGWVNNKEPRMWFQELCQCPKEFFYRDIWGEGSESGKVASEWDKLAPDTAVVVAKAAQNNWRTACRRDIAYQYDINYTNKEDVPGTNRSSNAFNMVWLVILDFVSNRLEKFKKATNG